MKDGEHIGLLGLPIELRRQIILEVLRYRHQRREPVLKQRVIDGRVRLRNRFDPNYPAETNIYVKKSQSIIINGNALLHTNRQLRRDTQDLIEDTLETGKVTLPFVLDLIFVKDVGILPTWMSFPYMPKKIKRLRINIRIFRPKRGLLPADWIPVAQYRRQDYDSRETPCGWNLYVVLLFYAMGRLSTSSEAVLTADPGFAEELSAESKAGSMDVYLSAVATYSVEQMLIHKNEFEHWPDGKEIRGYNEDKQSQGIFYKEGYFRFGRSIFTVPWKDDKELSWVREGKLASNDLFYGIADAFEYLTTSWLGSIHSWDFDKEQTQLIYFDAAAKYIGTIRHTPCKDVESYVLGGPYYLQYSWESILGDGEYTPDNIVKLFKAEKKKFHADRQVMHRMKLAKWRMDRGWWNQYQ
jgi:hypothetical protein